MISLSFIGGEGPNRAFEEIDGGHLEGCVDPQEKIVIEGVVYLAGLGVDAVDLAVEAIDPVGGFVCLGPGPESHLGLHLQRSHQSRPRVSLIHGGLASSRGNEGMGGMHQQRPGPAEEHEHLLVDLPGDRVRPEVSAVCDHRLTLIRPVAAYRCPALQRRLRGTGGCLKCRRPGRPYPDGGRWRRPTRG